MKRLFVVTLFVLTTLAPLGLAAQTTVFKFNQDGEFASLSQSTDPNSNFTLNVSRNMSNGGAATASISFVSFTLAADFSSETFTQIIGNIPASDFTGQNVQNLSLNFNTSDLDPTTSFIQTCTVDLNTLIITCGTPASGSIQLNFTQNGIQRTRVLALGEEITIGNFTTRVHQRSDNSTANASGTVFGTTISSGNATVGVNHNASTEFIKNN
jgi:hypothetical protein